MTICVVPMIKYEARMMMGRLTDGCQSDHGRLVHALESGKTAAYCRGKALCGAEPGRRSCGWSAIEERPIDCPRCLKKMG